VYQDEQKRWTVLKTPKQSDLLYDIVEIEITEVRYYLLSGMTKCLLYPMFLMPLTYK
jgi:hypothetical protein